MTYHYSTSVIFSKFPFQSFTPGMNTFNPLTLALKDCFETPLCDLPDTLRQRVETDFFPMPWDTLSAAQRREMALQLDYLHDPANEQTQKFWWDFFERYDALKMQLNQWETVVAPTAAEQALKEMRLGELSDALDSMDSQLQQAQTDYQLQKTPKLDQDDLLLADLATPTEHSDVGTPAWRKKIATAAANARHDRPGGTRDKQRQIRELWASGKFASRDVCAEQECAALEMSFSSARQALKNTPEPGRC
jgi:hypothetical protein